MLGVRADAPFRRRRPAVERRTTLSPAAFRSSRRALRLLLVGRIADHDGDRLLRLILLASRRDCAIGSIDLPSFSSSMKGLPSVSVMNSCSQAVGGALPVLSAPASRRSAEAAPPQRGRTEARSRSGASPPLRSRRAPRPRPDPSRPSSAIWRSTPSRNVPVPTAGSATVTSVERSPAARSNSGPRSASSTSRTIARHDFGRRVVGAGALAQRRCRRPQESPRRNRARLRACPC